MNAEKKAEAEASTLIHQRLGDVLANLYLAVRGTISELYGVEKKEAREKTDPFLMRLLRGAPNMTTAWFGLITLPDTARDVIIADYRADFDQMVSDLEHGFVQLLTSTVGVSAGNPAHDDALGALKIIDATALALMGMVVNPRYSYNPTKENDSPRVSLQQVLMSDHLAQSFARIAAEAISLRMGLERIQEGPSAPKEMSDAERARRYRARKRRRVAFQTTIDVYDDDIALLRRFGFLAPSEREDRDLVTRELEAFLLHSFLTYPHSPAPWRERVAKQRGRILSLNEREDDENQQ